MSLKWFCELVHMSLEFFCVPFLTILLWWWILFSVSEHCVYKRNLMFEGFISEHIILYETNGYFLWIWMTANHLTFVCFCVLCRMAIQVDKFDFDSMPVMDHDALRLATVRQQEEKRQQVQGGLINSTLDIHWTIISFTKASCPDNTIPNSFFLTLQWNWEHQSNLSSST